MTSGVSYDECYCTPSTLHFPWPVRALGNKLKSTNVLGIRVCMGLGHKLSTNKQSKNSKHLLQSEGHVANPKDINGMGHNKLEE